MLNERRWRDGEHVLVAQVERLHQEDARRALEVDAVDDRSQRFIVGHQRAVRQLLCHRVRLEAEQEHAARVGERLLRTIHGATAAAMFVAVALATPGDL